MKKIILSSAFLSLFFGTLLIIVAQTNDQFLIMSDSKPKATDSLLPTLRNPLIIVKKKERKLFLYDGEKLIKTYIIALGFAPEGDKETEGDGKTPEGEFYIFTKNPQSNFYLSLGVSYPSVKDAKRGLKTNLISKDEHDSIVKAIDTKRMPLQKTKLGGEIYIHGNGSSKDWTWGCVALDDSDMKEIFESIPVGAKVTIEP